MSFFSIITINLNNANGLQKTIKSVLSQTFNNLEYIIIDGGSTDGSVDVIKKYQDKISYWISEKDAGIYNAMNKGIAVAKGEYCLFLNSGDYLVQNDVLKNVVDRNLYADIHYGDVLQAREGLVVSRIKSPDKISMVFLLVGTIAHQSQFIKRSLFEEYGYYSTSLKMCSDWEFIVKLYFKKKHFTLKHIPILVSVYDLSGFSSSLSNYDIYYTERQIIDKQYFPKIMSWTYSLFVILLHSRLIKSSCIVKIINFLRNRTLKLMGAETVLK